MAIGILQITIPVSFNLDFLLTFVDFYDGKFAPKIISTSLFSYLFIVASHIAPKTRNGTSQKWTRASTTG